MTKREFLNTVFALAPNEANKIMDAFDEYVESNEPHWIPVTENCDCDLMDNEEGRDTMRIAQMFVNMVDVDTKYDNTAYIIGLAAILSRGGISAIDELKKINKKLPDVGNITIRL